MICLDASGCMRRPVADSTLLGLAKAAIKHALLCLPRGSEVAMVTFNTLSRVVLSPQPVNANLFSRIDAITPGGHTDLEAGMRTLISIHNAAPTPLITTCAIVTAGNFYLEQSGESLGAIIRAIKIWRPITYTIVAATPENAHVLQEVSRELNDSICLVPDEFMKETSIIDGIRMKRCCAKPEADLSDDECDHDYLRPLFDGIELIYPG